METMTSSYQLQVSVEYDLKIIELQFFGLVQTSDFITLMEEVLSVCSETGDQYDLLLDMHEMELELHYHELNGLVDYCKGIANQLGQKNIAILASKPHTCAAWMILQRKVLEPSLVFTKLFYEKNYALAWLKNDLSLL
ncbi:MAG: hypothetical protein ACK4VN_07665 [Bacteroidales bacterium]